MTVRLLTALAVLGLLAACAPAEDEAPPEDAAPPAQDEAPDDAAPPADGADDADVTVSDFAFQPDSRTIAAGTTITWANQDDVAHTATAEDGSFDVALSPGATGAHTFDAPGAYVYACSIHPQMVAEIVVN